MQPHHAGSAAARIARLDEALKPTVSAELPDVPRAGWLQTVRIGLGMPAAALGRRLGVSGEAVRRYEAAEQRGVIKLETLARAADALGCDLKYNLVPRVPLQEQVRVQAERVASNRLGAVDSAQGASTADREDFEAAVRRLMDGPRRSLW